MDRKVALVTGAGRGIGSAIAKKLNSEGYAIAVGDIAEMPQTMAVFKDFKAPAIFIKGDISTAGGRQHLIDTCLGQYGKIDVLVNNAGVAPKVRMDMLDTTQESMDFVLDINLKGTFFLTQLASRAMIEGIKAGKQERPKIINISSISAYTSSVARAEYCLSKAGVSMVTKLFADRLAEYGINVYEIRPGIIFTDMTKVVKAKYDKLIEEGLLPIKRWGYPEDIAKAVSAICNDYMPYSTGEVINVDGGFHLSRL